ncbi:MAG: hypothetical protein K6F31_07790, partial [Acetatifactor sp.]|nr:hypothetical protein [Acetatifactor sp.]
PFICHNLRPFLLVLSGYADDHFCDIAASGFSTKKEPVKPVLLAALQGRRMSGGHPFCADRSEAEIEP